MRTPIVLFILSALMLIFISCTNQSDDKKDSEKSKEHPNIIFILVDDMGYGDAKAFNAESEISTPHINKLAKSGMIFTDAHASASSCIPSRYGLLTGEYPFRAKHLDWRKKPLIDTNQVTFATVLKNNGYYTGMIGKWHLGFDYSNYNNLTGGPVDRGFDYYYGISRSLDQADYYYIENKQAVNPPTVEIPGSEGYGRNGWQGPFWRPGKAGKNFKHEEVLPTFTEKSIEFIDQSADTSAPFFLYIALASPHTPWLPSEEFAGTSNIGEWGDWVAENDYYIGKIIDAVDEKGIRENTLIFFTSDNGPVWWPEDIEEYGHRSTSIYRGMKFDAWEGGHRMPFIASWPGVIEAGSQSSRIVSNTDMLATFAHLMNDSLPSDAGKDSYSFLDALLNTDLNNSVREDIVGRPDNTDLYIRKGEWKLIGEDQLYNLSTDPSEQNNVISEHPEIVAELKQLLEKYKTEGRSIPY